MSPVQIARGVDVPALRAALRPTGCDRAMAWAEGVRLALRVPAALLRAFLVGAGIGAVGWVVAVLVTA